MQKLDLVGYAGVIIHAPGGVLMTSGQPILADKRLFKAANELIEHVEANAREDGVPDAGLTDYVGITLCEGVIANSRADEDDENEFFGKLTTLLALALHSNSVSHMIVEGRISDDGSIVVLNFFLVPANDFDHGRKKIIRYFDALDDLLAVPNEISSARPEDAMLH